ncbi:bifunctional phosphoribosylaminoimidazolecarboxamide formyltransferase/IMP cyclohydrolase [Vallitalea okinawensis]|uniref:bifunctional phosphoribosylaminoimidazolecarboxamide formyltransferase/IMP cyclohydrolase n=1 Tax=Vallitalea okinawensis TaxID=2078660 RepID=UPI002E8E4805|nr:bifunctional phosphoribosylaminoimidazolecarboxamide formyltransferase/IMP cyclohydrolase [Vallitalea okinawensis]
MRALISVSDKTGIVDFAKSLEKLGVEIISTGGTAQKLKEADVKVIGISEVTGFPECLDGRVKTLHPNIHAGLLAMRGNKEHMSQLDELNIEPIDLVVVNLYPFKETILKEGVTLEDAIENIDIGGPTMLRSAAKNYQDVTVVVDPEDYKKVITELSSDSDISLDTKFYLCNKVFSHTAHYDTLIADYMRKKRGDESYPETLSLTFQKVQDLRYGENPHQKAAFYKQITDTKGTLTEAVQLHGKPLSFNNINDTNGALELLKEFNEPTVVACKHANPCGVGSAENVYEAYMKAYNSDPVSIFGGIVVSNEEIDAKTAEEINKIYVEIVVAPDYTEDALQILKQKKNIRVLQLSNIKMKAPLGAYDLKKVSGGLLIQDIDHVLLQDDEKLDVVTERQPSEKEMKDMLFTWKIVKYAKSNGIAIGKDKQSLGVGPGQVNRIWACQQAIDHAKDSLGEEVLQGAALASDAFFPFADCVEEAAKAGITCIIQPGGSIRDQESIDACNRHNIAMVFTGMRHFKH